MARSHSATESNPRLLLQLPPLCSLLTGAHSNPVSRRRMLATEGVTAEAGAIKLFVLVLALAAVGLYVAASIAGAGMGLSDFVIDGTLFLVASAVVMVGVTLGWARFLRAVSEQGWVQRALSYMALMREWCIALVLCVGTLPIGAYLLASLLKQLTRKARGE